MSRARLDEGEHVKDVELMKTLSRIAGGSQRRLSFGSCRLEFTQVGIDAGAQHRSGNPHHARLVCNVDDLLDEDRRSRVVPRQKFCRGEPERRPLLDRDVARSDCPFVDARVAIA